MDEMPENDSRLLNDARRGNESAFLALYHRHRTPLFRFAWRLTGSVAAAEDVTQECFLTERIYDVLKVLNDRPPSRSAPKPGGERFSFEGVGIVIEGKPIGGLQNTWMRGGAIMIHLPDRGKFYLALAPSPEFPFRPSGWVDHNVLRFHAGAELVEITGKSNMLQKSEFGTVWVYYVPDPPGAGLGHQLEFHCADYLEQLLPKNEPKQE